MSLLEHAQREFDLLGWPGDDKMQKMVCDNVVALLTEFSSQGHSGSSAPYVLSVFNTLAKFQTLADLTGEDHEWNDVGEQDGVLYQNNRDSEVFKDDNGAYWINGRIFRDSDGGIYMSKGSRVPVAFPWKRPEPEIVDVDE